MFCKQCGQPLPQGAVFCPGCGLHSAIPGVAPMGGLVRPRSPRVFAGVCAGISRRYGWSLSAARVLTVILGIFIFPLMEILYICGWLLIPEEPLMPFPFPNSTPPTSTPPAPPII